MKKNKLKLIIILSVFSLVLIIIFCIFILKDFKDEQNYNIDESQAKVLDIENTKIYNILNTTSKKSVTTKIRNKSQDAIKDITIDYIEFDKNEKEISTKQIPVEVTLKKDEKAIVSIVPEDYTDTIDIIGYSYNKEDFDISVSLDKDEIKVTEFEDKKEESKVEQIKEVEEYKILDLSDFKQMDATSYRLNIKNISKKNIGNIILKVAEVNSENEYVSVSNISSNSTVEAKGSIKMILNSNSKDNTLEIIGYTYDDIENKMNIDVDLKANSASIIRN